MKIGVVCFSFPGGSGVLATELGRHLALRGHMIHFISYNQPFRLRFHENIFYHQVNVPQYELFNYPPYYLALSNKIAEVVDSEELDILHVHYAFPHSLTAYLGLQVARNKQVKIITTLHGTDITLVGNNPSFFRLTQFGMESSHGLTAVSDSLAEETRRVFGIKKPIKRIYNFVDPQEYRQLPCENIPCYMHEWLGREKILIHISNFRKVKRVDDVVRVFKLVNEAIPSRLLLVGDGPTCNAVQELVEELGLSGRVIFLGVQDNVVPLLSAADLLLLPSEKEAFGLVAIEAMACKVPVIASNIGGLPEVVRHGETGFLSSLGDVEDMAANAVRILEEPELHGQMAQKARQRVEKEFSVDRILPDYLQYYEEISAGTE